MPHQQTGSHPQAMPGQHQPMQHQSMHPFMPDQQNSGHQAMAHQSMHMQNHQLYVLRLPRAFFAVPLLSRACRRSSWYTERHYVRAQHDHGWYSPHKRAGSCGCCPCKETKNCPKGETALSRKASFPVLTNTMHIGPVRRRCARFFRTTHPCGLWEWKSGSHRSEHESIRQASSELLVNVADFQGALSRSAGTGHWKKARRNCRTHGKAGSRMAYIAP